MKDDEGGTGEAELSAYVPVILGDTPYAYGLGRAPRFDTDVTFF